MARPSAPDRGNCPKTSTNKIYFTPLQNPSIHGIILTAPKTSDAKGKPDAGDAGANLIR